MTGRAVVLQVQLRKFFCGNPNCSRKVVAQTALSHFQVYARRLDRARQPLQAMALLTGARPVARLCVLTGQPVSCPYPLL